MKAYCVCMIWSWWPLTTLTDWYAYWISPMSLFSHKSNVWLKGGNHFIWLTLSDTWFTCIIFLICWEGCYVFNPANVHFCHCIQLLSICMCSAAYACMTTKVFLWKTRNSMSISLMKWIVYKFFCSGMVCICLWSATLSNISSISDSVTTWDLKKTLSLVGVRRLYCILWSHDRL